MGVLALRGPWLRRKGPHSTRPCCSCNHTPGPRPRQTNKHRQSLFSLARGDGGKERNPTGSFGSATLEKTEAGRGQNGPPCPRLSSPRGSQPPRASPAADAGLGLAGSPMPAGHSQPCPAVPVEQMSGWSNGESGTARHSGGATGLGRILAPDCYRGLCWACWRHMGLWLWPVPPDVPSTASSKWHLGISAIDPSVSSH